MRTSRRWLLASMGASTVGMAAPADDRKGRSGPAKAPDKPRLAAPVLDCEKDYAQEVAGLKGWLDKPPKDETSAEASLMEAFRFGFSFNYGGLLPDYGSLNQPLRDAYRGLLKAALGAKWSMCVAQAFILGQLTRYFWEKETASNPPLTFRHLACAWAVFGRATSSCWCSQWVSGVTGSRSAYVLPRLPANLADGEIKILQLDEPCALCN